MVRVWGGAGIVTTCVLAAVSACSGDIEKKGGIPVGGTAAQPTASPTGASPSPYVVPVPGTNPTTSPTGTGTTPPAGTTFTLAVNVNGPGTVTSNPPGLLCNGPVCSGQFAAASAVALTASPTGGALFSGWGGACVIAGTGPCSVNVTQNTSVDANFTQPTGNYAGAYTNTRPGGNCTFNNAGNMTVTIGGGGIGGLTAAATFTGMELRNGSCSVVGHGNGDAPAVPLTPAGAGQYSGTWNVSVQGASGTLAQPFTIGFAGNQLTGAFTCTGCVNSNFTLTHQ